VEGAHNNTTVYRETDGARLFSLFGRCWRVMAAWFDCRAQSPAGTFSL